MLKAFREGPTRRPNANEWILDGLLVGVGVVRVLRGILRREATERDGSFRAWRLSWYCNVTPTGANKVIRRLERIGLVKRWLPARGEHADSWRLVTSHPLYDPLRNLFAVEREMVRRERIARRVTRRTTRPPRTS